MCLILFAYRCHPDYKLIVVANRDEFYQRPTAPVSYWADCPNVLAGQDLECGGTWMGITRRGCLAAVTNYRDPANQRDGVLSRGDLSRRFLCGNQEPKAYLAALDTQADSYNGFNLLVGDADSVWYYSNRERQIRIVNPGIHGLSNHLLDTPWPKVEMGKHRLAEILKLPSAEWESELWQLLADRSFPPDDKLPSTGVTLEWERVLSPSFIISPTYGTRVSTVMMIDYHGHIRFAERTFEHGQQTSETRVFEFTAEN